MVKIFLVQNSLKSKCSCSSIFTGPFSDPSFLAEIMLPMSFLIDILKRVLMMMKTLKRCQLPPVERQK